MTPRIRDQLKKELEARGFSSKGEAPNNSVVLDDDLLDAFELGELLDMMVTRREKVFRSTPVVGTEISRADYEDAVAAVEAIKETLRGCGSL